MLRLHALIMERVEYLASNHEDMETDDKISQVCLIWKDMGKQKDKDLLAQEIMAMVVYSLSDPNCLLHIELDYTPYEEDLEDGDD